MVKVQPANRKILSIYLQKAYENNGFISALIFGQQGVGKTTYALQILKDLYGDWDIALKHLYFNPKKAIEDMAEALACGERLKAIILDDAGTWLGRLRWFEPQKTVFTEFYDLSRSVTAGILFTSPSNNLLRALLNEIWYRIKITVLNEAIVNELLSKGFITREQAEIFLENPSNYAVADIYKISQHPDFYHLYVKHIAKDIFKRKLPNNVYKKYLKMRHQAVAQKIEQLKAILGNIEIEATPSNDKDIIDTMIIEMLRKGLSKAEISRRLGISYSTVFRRIKKLKEKGML